MLQNMGSNSISFSTNYNYASTKKWTWKRSKLTEGMEMVRDGIMDIKLKLDALCTRYVMAQGSLMHNGEMVTQVDTRIQE